MVVFQLGGTQLALANTEGVMSYRYVYTGELSPLLSVPRFGVLTTLRFEIRNMIFGEPSGRNSAQTEDPADATEEEPTGTEDTETEPVEGDRRSSSTAKTCWRSTLMPHGGGD
jgi:hypothetical protein